MLINKYEENDIEKIEELGSNLHDGYKFNLDTYSSCLVLKNDDKLIGFITYSIIYERAEIIDIIIDNEYRNKGYGKRLILKVIEEATSSNCCNITLEVSSLNKNAINFYKRNGFEIVGVRKNYYNDSDGYLMKKDLR